MCTWHHASSKSEGGREGVKTQEDISSCCGALLTHCSGYCVLCMLPLLSGTMFQWIGRSWVWVWVAIGRDCSLTSSPGRG